MIPGLGTLKTYGLMALGILAAVLFALFKNESAGRAKDKLKGEVQARKTAQATNKAVMDGINDEHEEIANAKNPTGKPNRSGFE